MKTSIIILISWIIFFLLKKLFIKILSIKDKKNPLHEWDTYSNFVLVLIALAGIPYIYYEIGEMQIQNELEERSLRQSYRPIGVMEAVSPKDSVKIVINNNTRDVLNFIVKSERKVFNKGEGTLVLIGWYTFITDKEINFYSKSVVENIKEGNIQFQYNFFDTRYQEGRNVPLFKNDEHDLTVLFKGVPGKNIYLYCIIWYKDQNGFLYDTVHFEFKEFKEEDILKNLTSYTGQLKIYIRNNFFHDYNQKEHNELYNLISKIGHPIKDFIGER